MPIRGLFAHWVVLLLTSGISGWASAQSVYTQTRDATLTDPSFSSQVAAGRYAAESDINAGTFKARSEAAPSSNEYAYAGIFQSIDITNAGTSAVTFPAGAIRASVSGSYSRSGIDDPVDGASGVVVATFNLTGAFQSGTEVTHSVSESYTAGISESLGTDEINNNGAVYANLSASPAGLSAEILMPEITLDPGESISLSLLLTTSAIGAGGGSSVVDFHPAGMAISVVHPPGATITTNLPAQPGWLTSAASPVPILSPFATLLLLASLAAIAFASRALRPGGVSPRRSM